MLNLEDLLKCFDSVFKQMGYLFEPPAVTAKNMISQSFFYKNDFDLVSLNTCADAIYIYYLQWYDTYVT